jgi:CIC family chloride channel protein
MPTGVPMAAAYAPELDPLAPVASLATLQDVALTPASDISAIIKTFDEAHADDLAVVDERGVVVGVVSEKHARRRFFEESEASHRALFGER